MKKVKITSGKRWKVILESKGWPLLLPIDKSVLTKINDTVDNQGVYFGTNKYLMHQTGRSEATIKRVKKHLVELGYLVPLEGYDYRSPHYNFVPEGWVQNEPSGFNSNGGGFKTNPSYRTVPNSTVPGYAILTDVVPAENGGFTNDRKDDAKESQRTTASPSLAVRRRPPPENPISENPYECRDCDLIVSIPSVLTSGRCFICHQLYKKEHFDYD